MAYLLGLVVGILYLVSEINCHDENKYYNHTLFRITPVNDAQLEVVQGFLDPLNQVDVFKRSYGINDSLEILVPPERLDYVKNFAKDLPLQVQSENYGEEITSVARTARRRAISSNAFRYMSYDEMMAFVKSLAMAHRDLIHLQKVGHSYQGRDLILVKISSNHKSKNPVIFIDAGIHSREWVAPSMALYLIDRLVTDPESRSKELNGVDWYILPLVNPDGYEYSRSSASNRMWRKTRSQHIKSNNCLGADGNRNYGFQWAVSGVSHNPCDRETYAGPKPFSEPETRAVRDIMMAYKDHIKLYVSLHAYGNYLVYPWGYTGELLPKTWRSLDVLARKVSDAVVDAGGRPFNVLSAGKWYPAAGGSDDYAFGAVGIPYSYTMELTDGYEFVFPESLLFNILPQFYQGFRVFGKEIKRQFGKS